MGGYVHSGILRSARIKIKKLLPIMKDLLEVTFIRYVNPKDLQKYPNYKIKMVGHSLGGGMAAMMTIILTHGNNK